MYTDTKKLPEKRFPHTKLTLSNGKYIALIYKEELRLK